MQIDEEMTRREILALMLELEPHPIDQTGNYSFSWKNKKNKWVTSLDINAWECWLLTYISLLIKKEARVKDNDTGEIFGTSLALIYLFSNRLTDRDAVRHDLR